MVSREERRPAGGPVEESQLVGESEQTGGPVRVGAEKISDDR